MRLFKLILLLMLAVSLVPTAMVGLTSISRTRELLVRDAQELAQERVKQLRLQTESILDEPSRAVMGLAQIPDFFSLPVSEQRPHIAAILSQRPEIAVLTLYSAAKEKLPGVQGFAAKEIPPTEVAEHEAQAVALLQDIDGLKASEVMMSPSRKLPVFTIAFPIGQPVKGYAAAEVALTGLERVLANQRVGSNGFAYVVDRHGKLVVPVAKLRPLPVGGDLTDRPAVKDFVATLASTPASLVLRVGNFGPEEERVVGAYTAVPRVGWAVISEQPIAEAYAQVDTMERQIAVAVLGAILIAFALAAFVSRAMAKPLKKFGSAALEIAKGRFGVQVDLRAKNELGELAQTFNYMSAQIEAYDHETKRLYDSLENGYLETIVALANSIDSKDAYTRGHSQRVGDTAVEIGREMGLTEREIKELQYGGILHDIGKIGIVESILCKQTRLTEEEMVVMKEHPLIGDTIIGPVSFLASVRAAVRNHHERWDGTGYPDKLKGEQIPLIARIVNCADTFDAVTSTRPYQKAFSLDKALEIMENLRGTQLDPKVFDALRRVIEKKGVQLEGARDRQKLAG